ncbi:FAD-binding protein [Paracoccus sp. 1_MG-2023]|uniref:FAD-binding protein n=1 Tax=unclassified Paracoccus (in: a-proteobacteria) TaxID=2688777 RepID=UPI00209023A7|nr:MULTISPECIES: FAD-binding protein [unclassified Paracoccus (in: a-proteobacteria)]MDO6669478.1 FAD-binding protein [Paracoccus sp. 1_MG-2023]
MTPVLTPASEAELSEILTGRTTPLRINGGGTRLRPDGPGDALTTSAISGVVTYEPGELTLIARAGTPVQQIETMLAAEGQALSFEPMDHRRLTGLSGDPTIGGIVAANVSGPRRILAGACRDHLLGVRFVDGQGRILKNGGRVMKNVTGMDLGKLLAGSHGTLGILTEVALKVLPMAESSRTLVIGGIDATRAVQDFATALSTPFEVSGAAFHDGTAWLRIEGLTAQVAYRTDRLTALLGRDRVEIIEDEDSRSLWRDLRDVAHLTGDDPVWRILCKPSEGPAIADRLGGQCALDWGGAAVWYSGPKDAATVRAAGGHAMLVRGQGAVFPPEAPVVAELSQRLRRTFDPANILNPGLMGD